MLFQHAIEFISDYVVLPSVCITLHRKTLDDVNGRNTYNQIIREKVAANAGIYLWIDKKSDQILYVGMAGAIKTDGRIGNHSIRDRLLASRIKDKKTGKDIQTNDYIISIMKEKDIEYLDIIILYSKAGEAPAFLEALLLNHFYQKEKRLPILNKSF